MKSAYYMPVLQPGAKEGGTHISADTMKSVSLGMQNPHLQSIGDALGACSRLIIQATVLQVPSVYQNFA